MTEQMQLQLQLSTGTLTWSSVGVLYSTKPISYVECDETDWIFVLKGNEGDSLQLRDGELIIKGRALSYKIQLTPVDQAKVLEWVQTKFKFWEARVEYLLWDECKYLCTQQLGYVRQ